MSEIEESNDGRLDLAPPRRRGKWRRRIGRMLLALILLLALLIGLSQIPAMQTWAAQRAADYLSNKLNTEVSVERLRLRWLDEIALDGLFIRDLDADTVIRAQSIYVDLEHPIRGLIDGRVHVDALKLSEAMVNLRWLHGRPANNLTLLLNHGQAPDRSGGGAAQDTSSSLLFWLDVLTLDRTLLINYHEPKGKEERFYVEDGRLTDLALDLKHLYFDAGSLTLNSPDVQIRHYPLPPSTAGSEEDEDDAFPFRLTADKVDITDGHFILYKEHLRDPIANAPYMDFHDLDLTEIEIRGEGLYMKEWTFGGIVDRLSVRAANGFVIKDASASRIAVTETQTTVEDLFIETNRTDLDADLTMRYNGYPDFTAFDRKVRFDLYLHDSKVGIVDLLQFVKGLRPNPFFSRNREEFIYADGRFVGTINNVNGRNLDLNLGGQLQVKGLVDIRDFNDKKKTRINLDLQDLRTDMTTIRSLVPDLRLPSQFDKLGRIQLQGVFDGLLSDFAASGEISTDLGDAAFDMWMDLKNGLTLSRYGGELDLKSFDLGRWTSDERLGMVSISARITEANGMTKSSVQGRLSAKIRKFEFMGYDYKNADFTGFMKDELIEGQFDIDDDNIQLSWEGRLGLKDRFDMDATGRLDHIDLLALNLTKRPLMISSTFDLDIEDIDETNILGSATLSDLHLGTSIDSMQYLDSVTLVSSLVDSLYQLQYRSTMADIDIEGQYALFRLPDYFKQHFIIHNPTFSRKLGLRIPRSVDDADFTFDAHIKDSRDLTSILHPALGVIQDTELSGQFSTTDGFLLEMHVPWLQYDSVTVTDWHLYLSGEGSYSNLVTSHEGLRIKDTELKALTIFADLERDTVHLNFNEYSYEELFDEMNIEGRVYLYDDLWQLSLNNSELTIFGERWKATEDNYVRFGPDYVKVKDVNLTNHDQAIRLNSINANRGLSLDITSIPLGRINDVITYDKVQFEGLLSGSVRLPELKDLSTLESDLTAEDVLINGDRFGTLDIAVTADGAGGTNIRLELDEALQSLDLDGTVILPTKANGHKASVDARIRAVKVPASIIEYFVSNGLSNTTGLIDADIKVTGPMSNLKMDGFIDIPASSFKVDILGTTYFAEAQRVAVSSDLIDLTGVSISDRLGNTGLVSGGLTHQNLSKLGFDATISSDEILVLETTKADNEIYYGTCYGEVFARFNGTVNEPVIYVSATNKPNSKFIINNDRGGDAGELDFIKFINPGEDSIVLEDDQLGGVDLTIDLVVTPEVEVSIIIDESTRDIIQAKGHGDLHFGYSPEGEITLFGDYVIDEGDYLFTYSVGGIVPVTKPFSLQQGSKLLWTDDPFDAYLDIRADYRTLASPYNLLADQGGALADEARTRTDVVLDLIIQGQMFSPNISFDIEVPELVGPVKSAVDIELARIESDPTLLQAQAAALIVFGDFTNNSVAGSSVSAVANTIGEWLSNQVSFYLTNIVSEVIRDWEFIDDIQVDIGLRLPSGDYSVAGEVSPDGQVNFQSSELGVSTKVIMFDRRLELGLKGDFVNDVSGLGGGQANVLNTDVELDYVLTPDGRWRLRVYTRQDQFYNSRRTRSGIGFNWRRSYDSLDEFDRDVKRLFAKKEGAP